MTRRVLAALAFVAAFLALPTAASAEPNVVKVVKDDGGVKLTVDGKDFMVFGMNWGYSPVGTNYSYSLWTQPDPFIEEVLHRDMGLLKAMGVNSIRQFSDVPPRWVTWIHKNYGIYTAINPLMGRYGAEVNGTFVPKIDYGNPTHRKALLEDLAAKAEQYKNVPGVLMWLLGNENNYGLSWTTYEIEALPGQQDAARAESLYTLYGEAIATIKARDTSHPVSLVNGDLQYIDLVAKHCKGLDIMGANVYRGASARDFFDDISKKLGTAAMFTEFGADAFNARTAREDAESQADYLLRQWQEIYEHTHGKGRAQNAVGGFIFQWTDGWWKVGQTKNLDVHDTIATWPNDAYAYDFVPGDNNMNEEWFGIAAIEPPDERGFYRVRPRTAYYALKAAFALDPYAQTTSLAAVRAHFQGLRPSEFAGRYEASSALAQLEALSMIRVSNLRMNLDTYAAGGNSRTLRGTKDSFDHTESFFTDFVLQPTPRLYARLSLNFVANVAQNRLNPIFYESRGRPATTTAATTTAGGTTTAAGTAPPATGAVPGAPGSTSPSATQTDLQRIAVYQAEFGVDEPWFALDGYYRTGHYHWGDEGDYFGLYRQAFYGPNIDIYNGNAPFGVVYTGKRALDGLKVALGPELYWGANPSIIVKYRRAFGPLAVTVMHQEDLARRTTTTSTFAVSEQVARRSSLHMALTAGRFTFDAGVIVAGAQRVGKPFVWARPVSGRGYLDSGYEVFDDKISPVDMLGTKAKITLDGGAVRWYAQGAFRGLVADGGPDSIITLTDWTMKQSGRGNQFGGSSGATFDVGKFQIGPHVLYQRPLIGPNPVIADHFSVESGQYYKAVRPRNVLDDPFVVRDNRETLGLELLIAHDSTPASWFFAFDRDLKEDAPFAASLDVVYRMQPTSQDSAVAILANGALVPLGGAPPKRDVWDATFRFVANPFNATHLFGALFVAQDQSTGVDPRVVTRYGADVQLMVRKVLLVSKVHFNDWGPYDYQRVFNLTFPVQCTADLSYALLPSILGPAYSRVGIRGIARTLDQYSENFVPDLLNPGRRGFEYEAGAYVHLGL